MTRSNVYILVIWGTQRYLQEGLDWIFLNPSEFLLENNTLFSQSGQPRRRETKEKLRLWGFLPELHLL